MTTSRQRLLAPRFARELVFELLDAFDRFALRIVQALSKMICRRIRSCPSCSVRPRLEQLVPLAGRILRPVLILDLGDLGGGDVDVMALRVLVDQSVRDHQLQLVSRGHRGSAVSSFASSWSRVIDWPFTVTMPPPPSAVSAAETPTSRPLVLPLNV